MAARGRGGCIGRAARLAGAVMPTAPAFQGLVAIWRRGSELFAEVVAPANSVAVDRMGTLLDGGARKTDQDSLC